MKIISSLVNTQIINIKLVGASTLNSQSCSLAATPKFVILCVIIVYVELSARLYSGLPMRATKLIQIPFMHQLFEVKDIWSCIL